jgi:hypothetical protein
MREKSIFKLNIVRILFVVILVSVFGINIVTHWGESELVEAISFWPIVIDNLYFSFCVKITLAVLIVLITNNLGRNNKLIERNRSTVVVFFVILLATIPFQLVSISQYISVFLMLGVFYYFLKIYNQPSISKLVFYSAVLISFIGFFQMPLMLLIGVLWIGISLIRPFEIKEYLISLIGFGLPILYYYSISFLFDSEIHSIGNLFHLNLIKENRLPEIFSGMVFLVLSFFSLLNRSHLGVHQRNQMSFLILICLLGISLTFLVDPHFVLVASIPASYFISNLYDSFEKKWILEVVAILYVLAIPALSFI